MPNYVPEPPRRGRPFVMLLGTILGLLLASSPMSAPAVSTWRHNSQINSLDYKQDYGYWEVIDMPEEYKVNAIHAAMMPTGKVLLIAGTGNNRERFNAYQYDNALSVLKTVVFDPATRKAKVVPTPSDLFCSGHAFLQSGNLLVAGGTSGYELLKPDVKKPAGAMVIHNEDPDSPVRVFKKGTKFTSPSGKVYVSTQDAVVQPANKIDHGSGDVMIHHSSIKIFVEAVKPDASYVTDMNEQYKIEGLQGADQQNIYGQGGPMTLNKQDFRGDNQSFEFDPFKEEYVRTSDLNENRWYPTLTPLTNGQVLATSGLDAAGIITETTEIYDPATKKWSWGPSRPFPTYAAIFRTMDPNVLFYSGSSAGYGPVDKGREPGFWNIEDNSFQPVKGLTQTDILETSGSVMLPPRKGSNDGSQSHKIMLAGGGGIGESKLVTARTAIIDLAEKNPRYRNGPNLPEAVRYVNLTVTPWDEIFAAGGSQDYRGKQNSYSNKSYFINPTTLEIKQMADEPVNRSYHSGSLLLPDGTIMMFGNDPLYSDEKNTTPGVFEQRLEIYTPPQLFKGERPVLKNITTQKVQRGQQLNFETTDAARIKTARLIPPSSSTHVTNIEQRSVAAMVRAQDGNITIDIPADENLLPNGWYMLFVVDGQDRPSEAVMIQVVD